MSTENFIQRVNILASTQHGLVRLDQFAPADHRRVRHLDRRNILERVATGIYRVAGSPQTWSQAVHAAAWGLGNDGVVGHTSAARVLGLDRFEQVRSIEFTVRRRARGRRLSLIDGVTVHSTVDLPVTDIRRVNGLAVTSPERTILDLARSGIDEQLVEAAVDSSLRLRLTTLDRIVDRLAQVEGSARSGLAVLEGVLLSSGGHSVLERRFLKLVRSAGLPVPVPQVVHRAGGRHVARVDFLFPDHGVVVEVSGGRGHSSPSERAKDALRRNELQQMGRQVFEFTYEHVVWREAYVIDTLKEALSCS